MERHRRRSSLVGLAVVAMVAACSCQGGTSSSPAPSVGQLPAGSSPSAVTGPSFVSERYGYEIQLPPGWYVREQGVGRWTPQDLSYVGPGTDSFELDYPGRGTTVEDAPGVTYGLYISAANTAPSSSLQEWTDLLAATMSADSSCQGAPEQEATTVDGEDAALLVYDRADCTHDHHVLLASTLNDEQGFAILWLAKRGEADSKRSEFDRTLATFKFMR
jgi:hypothetical protein